MRTYPGKQTANNPANNRLMEIAHAVPCFLLDKHLFAMTKAPGIRAKSWRLTASRCVKGKLSEARVKGIGPRPGEYATAKTAPALARSLRLGRDGTKYSRNRKQAVTPLRVASSRTFSESPAPSINTAMKGSVSSNHLLRPNVSMLFTAGRANTKLIAPGIRERVRLVQTLVPVGFPYQTRGCTPYL